MVTGIKICRLIVIISFFLVPVHALTAQECSDCHEKFSKAKHGNLMCVNCHTDAKDLPHPDKLKKPDCLPCHQNVYNVYKNTKHAQGAATHCTDCHDPHQVRTYRELNNAERIAICARCHGEYKKQHAWLPHAELHFTYLECSTCHSPRSEKGMAFNLTIRTPEGERKLEYNDVMAAFGGKKRTKDYIDTNGDWRVSSSELVPFLQALERSKRGKVAVTSSILVTKIYHDYSQVEKKDKVCATCHSNEAPFYQTMYLVLPEAKGFTRIPVKGTVLSAVPSSIAVNIFLLGERKIRLSDIRALFQAHGEARREAVNELGFKWIDIAGLFLIAVILLFIWIHIILRIVLKR